MDDGKNYGLLFREDKLNLDNGNALDGGRVNIE